MDPCFARLVAILCLTGIASIGCAAGGSDDPSSSAPAVQPGADAAAQPETSLQTDTGAQTFDVVPNNDGAPGTNCASGTSLVYVLGKTHELYSFDPKSLGLKKIGLVDCPQGGGTATPFSMAIDRHGVAWVLYNDGKLYNVSTSTAACSATGYVPDQHGYTKFGMGFVSNAPGSQDETLYVANEDGIATLDTKSLTLTPVGGTFGFSAAAELTGTGDAQLFGLFFGFPPYLSQIDKSNSQLIKEMPLDTVNIGTGFAYAFWGGDFWVFTAPDGQSSQIDRFQPSSGGTTTTVVVPSVGFKIIGAGVSTCAPVKPPA